MATRREQAMSGGDTNITVRVLPGDFGLGKVISAAISPLGFSVPCHCLSASIAEASRMALTACFYHFYSPGSNSKELHEDREKCFGPRTVLQQDRDNVGSGYWQSPCLICNSVCVCVLLGRVHLHDRMALRDCTTWHLRFVMTRRMNTAHCSFAHQ